MALYFKSSTLNCLHIEPFKVILTIMIIIIFREQKHPIVVQIMKI